MVDLNLLLAALTERCEQPVRIKYYVTQYQNQKKDWTELQTDNLIYTCTYMDTNLRLLP